MRSSIVLDSPADFKKFVGAQNFRVTFRKANGQFRAAHANCAQVVGKGIIDDDIKEARADAGQVSFFDIDKKATRSFILCKMTRLEIGGKVYQFGL